jgi:hypothetical protein
MSDALERFVTASPATVRPGLRILLALGKRPRGRALLAKLPPADSAANGLLAMAHFDEPAASIPLGYDPDAVVARGRELRRSEGRP